MKIYKMDCSQKDWDEFIQVFNSGEKFEIDEKMYFYWLEVLPPVFMNRRIDFRPGHEGQKVFADFGFAEGAEEIKIFWKSIDGKRFFGQCTNQLNRG